MMIIQDLITKLRKTMGIKLGTDSAQVQTYAQTQRNLETYPTNNPTVKQSFTHSYQTAKPLIFQAKIRFSTK